jgi:hypothetical protein
MFQPVEPALCALRYPDRDAALDECIEQRRRLFDRRPASSIARQRVFIAPD